MALTAPLLVPPAGKVAVQALEQMYREFDAALRHPCSESWRTILGYGERLRRLNDSTRMQQFVAMAARELREWPPEFSRPCPAPWPTWVKDKLQYLIHETKTYGMYEARVCSDKRLLLSDGTQAVMLRRRPTGAARTMQGAPMSLGEAGEPDLQGGMVIEVGPPDCHSGPAGAVRLDVRVSLEVKMYSGATNEAQETTLAVLRRRGGIVEVVETVEQAVRLLVGHRERLQGLLR